ncbi:hypothetical protein [Nocardia altamirensis]|uniref:hypothetical protein n=1 Tax=Nocardia altamirensis TaxID=472158 RepID=UPI00114C9AA3|nr:hypothetical protein [Nocardia altamirensis]
MAAGRLRSVRVPDEVWDEAMARAQGEGRSLSEVIVEGLDRYRTEGTAGEAQQRAAVQVRAAMELLGVVAETLESGARGQAQDSKPARSQRGGDSSSGSAEPTASKR